jgi:hypothetical protein
MSQLTVAERRLVQSRLTSALMLMGTADIYWDEPRRRTLARQIDALRKKRKANALPEGAVLVGRYSYGVSSCAVIDDLELLLSEMNPRPPAAGGKVHLVGAG